MNRRLRLRSGWTGTGSQADPYRPAVLGHHSLLRCEDASSLPGGTGTPTLVVLATPSIRGALRSDARYRDTVEDLD